MKFSVSSDTVKVGIVQKGLALLGCDYWIPCESLQTPTSWVHTLTQTYRATHTHTHVCTCMYIPTCICLYTHVDTANNFTHSKSLSILVLYSRDNIYCENTKLYIFLPLNCVLLKPSISKAEQGHITPGKVWVRQSTTQNKEIKTMIAKDWMFVCPPLYPKFIYGSPNP